MSRAGAISKNRLTLPTLTDAADFDNWVVDFDGICFQKKTGTKFHQLAVGKILKHEYFKTHTDFKEAYKTNSKDENGGRIDAFDDKDFGEDCLEHACDTTQGFEDWVYDLFPQVLCSLSPELKEKVSSVEMGNLVDLAAQIKIAIKYFEVFDPTKLEVIFVQLTMEKDANNDVMRFLSVLKTHMRRLKVAKAPVSDEKAMIVLLAGLHQDIFGDFVNFAERFPVKHYSILEQAVKKEAAKPKILAKLAAIVPGQTSSTLVLRTRSEQDAQLDRLEARIAVAEAVAQQRKSPGVCWDFQNGKCTRGADCKFSHEKSESVQRQRGGRGGKSGKPKDGKWCALHLMEGHDTKECHLVKKNPALLAFQGGAAAAVNTLDYENMRHADAEPDYTIGHFNVCTQHVLAMPVVGQKIDRWVCDGGSTANGTYDRSKCHNIRKCRVLVKSADSKKEPFFVTEMGDCDEVVQGKNGEPVRVRYLEVLISTHFPFHILSEIKLLKQGATAVKKEGDWRFYTKDGQQFASASQQLLNTPAKLELYFIDKYKGKLEPRSELAAVCKTTRTGLAHAASAPRPEEIVHGPALPPPPKISSRRNDAYLMELHLALGHWNFRDIAAHFGLTLPDPVPQCWACLMSKPRAITHDKVSTRAVTRTYEGLAADAKGPMSTPTSEGYLYFFVIVCLYCKVHWVILAKTQAMWSRIWPEFVTRAEAETGRERCVAFAITDNHKVHTQVSMAEFNVQRGIFPITSGPFSQWQDPAESGIRVITYGARTSMIQGGGHPWMWGGAVQHQQDAVNLTPPAIPVPGHEDKCRWQILYPSETRDKLLRRQFPFLCLFMKTVPQQLRRADFQPRAVPCLSLRYDRSRKSWALLTLPNLQRTWSVEGRHVPGVFPLRVTNNLHNKLYRFLRTDAEASEFDRLAGPSGILRQQRPAVPTSDADVVVQPTPTAMRQRIVPEDVPGPGHSSTRGYRPSAAGLQSAANIAAAVDERVFTPDELALRTPHSTAHALSGPDSKFWRPAICKDYNMLRAKGCFKNITEIKPTGSNPPACEQRFKVKYTSKEAVRLCDLEAEAWKARTIARGDRFRHGVHYDETAAPVVITPALKIMIAWAVELGLEGFQVDETAAFYGNDVDVKGIVVKLPPGYNPHGEDMRDLSAPPLYGELAKSVPGMPQGSLVHYAGMVPDLRALGFAPAAADPCLFVHVDKDEAIAMHVDDGILFCGGAGRAEAILGPSGLGRRRKLTWGPLKDYLGMQFEISYTAARRIIFLHQRNYAVTVLRRADMWGCNPVTTPAVAGRKYTKTSAPADDAERAALAALGMTKAWYASINASLSFLAVISRKDQLYAQGKNSKYVSNPGKVHFDAIKHQLKFTMGTLGYGITFEWRASDPSPADGPLRLEAWSDSSYADDVDTGKTTLGYLIKANGATVAAASKLSNRVDSCVNHSELHAFGEATSTTLPGECVADGASEAFNRAARDITWARGVKAALEHRDESSIAPVPVYVDNSGVISVIRDRTMKAANKHAYKTICENRERVHEDKLVVPIKIHTSDNLANGLTKQEPGLKASAAQLRMIAGPSPFAS